MVIVCMKWRYTNLCYISVWLYFMIIYQCEIGMLPGYFLIRSVYCHVLVVCPLKVWDTSCRGVPQGAVGLKWILGEIGADSVCQWHPCNRNSPRHNVWTRMNFYEYTKGRWHRCWFGISKIGNLLPLSHNMNNLPHFHSLFLPQQS